MLEPGVPADRRRDTSREQGGGSGRCRLLAGASEELWGPGPALPASSLTCQTRDDPRQVPAPAFRADPAGVWKSGAWAGCVVEGEARSSPFATGTRGLTDGK